LVVKV